MRMGTATVLVVDGFDPRVSDAARTDALDLVAAAPELRLRRAELPATR